nr:hypothetical protein [Candidatus Sigynarchaeum springense]
MESHFMDIAIHLDKREAYPNDKITCTIHVAVKNKTKAKVDRGIIHRGNLVGLSRRQDDPHEA